MLDLINWLIVVGFSYMLLICSLILCHSFHVFAFSFVRFFIIVLSTYFLLYLRTDTQEADLKYSAKC